MPPAATGLGQAIVQSLVKGAGGRISVDDAPEGGARFRVEVPLADRSEDQ